MLAFAPDDTIGLSIFPISFEEIEVDCIGYSKDKQIKTKQHLFNCKTKQPLFLEIQNEIELQKCFFKKEGNSIEIYSAQIIMRRGI